MTAPIARQKTISLRNDYLVRQPITYYDQATDSYLPWPAAVAPTVRFSVEPTGYDSNGVASTLAIATITAGAFIVGRAYTILTVGSTNFTAIGASANTVGVQFIATGAGSGTGTASANLGPFSMTESGATDGTYFYNVAADLLTPALADYVGQTIYQVVEGAKGTTYYGLTDVQALFVLDARFPT